MIKKIIERIKFEHIIGLGLLGILSVALFYFKADSEITYLILGALIGAFNNHYRVKVNESNKDENK